MSSPEPISRPRFGLLVTLGVYPLITALTYLTAPWTTDWPIWGRTLLIAPVMVGIILYVLLPLIHQSFHGFLRPGSD